MTLCQANKRISASRLSRLLLGACAAACMLPATAHALVMPDPATFKHSEASFCPARQIEPAAPGQPAHAAEAPKTAAILGGQPSALELIRQQQGQLGPETAPAISLSSVRAAPVSYSSSCLTASSLSRPSLPAVSPATIPVQASSDSFLGSSRVGIRNTPFTDDWQRVSASNLGSTQVETLLGGDRQIGVETLSLVNRWANRSIEYAEDLANYNARDYWATASETLQSGRGDCEDFAILKYQMLAALGFDRREMFLTLARDLVRNADHAVLVVRVDGRNYMLDNATDVLLPATASYDYRPTMSFNTESAWLHGLSTAATTARVTSPRQTQLSYLSDSDRSSARVTGLSR